MKKDTRGKRSRICYLVAGSPMSGIGGLFYLALLGVAIITRRYKSNKRNASAKRVAAAVLIFVFVAVLIGGLQAFKVFDIKNISSLMFFKIKDAISSSILKIEYQKWWTQMVEVPLVATLKV